MSSLSTSETIQQFQSIFAELGIPRHLHCDRGSNYTSMEFQQFMQGLNVKLSYSSSEHHSSNYAERSVQVVKGFMKRSVEWPICLLEYLMTPIRHQGVDNSPLKLMQKRTIRGLLPVRQQETNIQDYENYHAGKQEQAKYQSGKPLQELPEGSNILFYSERESQWLPGVIVQRLHDRSYIIISEKGRKVVRNRIDVKQYHKDVHVRFQSSYKRSITAPKTSLPSPLTVNKTVQQQPSDTSPQDPLDSSRPNNSNHQKPSLPSQKSSTKSFQLSSTKISSSSSSSQKPKADSSLQKLSTGEPKHHKAGSGGNISPHWQKIHSKSNVNQTTSSMVMPLKMRSSRMVPLPDRFKDWVSFRVYLIMMYCKYVYMFAKKAKKLD